MTRTEKVREALQAVRRDYELMNQIIAAHPTVAHPFTIGPKVADEALSLLDGCVIVPREPTEETLRAGAIAFEGVDPVLAHTFKTAVYRLRTE